MEVGGWRLCLGCPSLGVAQPNPSNRIDHDVLIRLGLSYKFSVHINTLLQLFHPLENASTNVAPGMPLKMTGMQTRSSDDVSARYSIRFLFIEPKRKSPRVPSRANGVGEGLLHLIVGEEVGGHFCSVWSSRN
jgi:hypothetical protein